MDEGSNLEAKGLDIRYCTRKKKKFWQDFCLLKLT